MVFEHFAVNVNNVNAVTKWYVAHVGLKVVVAKKEPPFMTFLADSSDRVVIELYNRTDVPITDFTKEHHIAFHVAFISENAEQDKQRLVQEGAIFVEEFPLEGNGHLVMLRDPWGMPLQLCQRAKQLV